MKKRKKNRKSEPQELRKYNVRQIAYNIHCVLLVLFANFFIEIEIFHFGFDLACNIKIQTLQFYYNFN